VYKKKIFTSLTELAMFMEVKTGRVANSVMRKMMMDLWVSKSMLHPDEEKQVVIKTNLRELVLYW
jgi:hypothetical protein